jgi:hypothetical protein
LLQFNVFSGKLGDECLNGEIFYSLKGTQIVIGKWWVEYNTSGRTARSGSKSTITVPRL